MISAVVLAASFLVYSPFSDSQDPVVACMAPVEERQGAEWAHLSPDACHEDLTGYPIELGRVEAVREGRAVECRVVEAGSPGLWVRMDSCGAKPWWRFW